MDISVHAGPCCLSGHLQSPLCLECEVETDSPGAWYGLHVKMSPSPFVFLGQLPWPAGICVFIFSSLPAAFLFRDFF